MTLLFLVYVDCRMGSVLLPINSPSYSQSLEIVTGKPVNRPFVHRFRAEFLIKLNGGFVPIQNRPFHPPTLPIISQPCEMKQQLFPNSLPPIVRLNVQILQIEAGTANECGKCCKVKSESHGPVFPESQKCFSARFIAKQSFMNIRIRGDNRLTEFFILGQFADKSVKYAAILGDSGTYGERIIQGRDPQLLWIE